MIGGMRFTLKELLLLVGCVALGMGAFEFVSRIDSRDLFARYFAELPFAFWPQPQHSGRSRSFLER